LLLSHLHAQARKVTREPVHRRTTGPLRQQSPKRAAAACTERIAGTKALRVDLGLPEQEVIEGLKAAAGYKAGSLDTTSADTRTAAAGFLSAAGGGIRMLTATASERVPVLVPRWLSLGGRRLARPVAPFRGVARLLTIGPAFPVPTLLLLELLADLFRLVSELVHDPLPRH
jgi:hypothetical protein